jgi:hypothetical protein
MVQRAPQAEAMAASWAQSLRPLATRIYALRRRIATITVTVFAGLLFVHVMFGANGMIVYKQKRAEYESLKNGSSGNSRKTKPTRRRFVD